MSPPRMFLVDSCGGLHCLLNIRSAWLETIKTYEGMNAGETGRYPLHHWSKHHYRGSAPIDLVCVMLLGEQLAKL